jgi:predicted AlkP superfamily pyrophosphatase or phosphodiesterase
MFTCRIASLPVWLFLISVLIACVDTKKSSTGREDASEDDTIYVVGTGGKNSESRKESPYLILVSIDGFRWDYLDLYPAPAIKQLAASGVRAKGLVPVFPVLTFPNHYSIATGLYPANHGIVANRFPGMDQDDWYNYRKRDTVQDGRWYGGEPIWVAAERHGLVSAAYFFVGTEAPVGGISPTHWFVFDQDVPGEQRVDQVLQWLSQSPETRPHMITLYFEEVDQVSHRFGPGSPENIAAIANVDGHIERLVQGISNLAIADEVSIVLVSDHGQASYREDAETLILDEVVDLDGFAVVDGGSAAFLYARAANRQRLVEVRDAINESWQHGRAWLREEAPESFHVADNSRFPEIIVLADPHYSVIGTADRHYIMTPGDHGWSPEFPDMHGIFIAVGPRLPQGAVINAINAVDVYPMMREILELPQISVDGDASVLLPLLGER